MRKNWLKLAYIALDTRFICQRNLRQSSAALFIHLSANIAKSILCTIFYPLYHSLVKNPISINIYLLFYETKSSWKLLKLWKWMKYRCCNFMNLEPTYNSQIALCALYFFSVYVVFVVQEIKSDNALNCKLIWNCYSWGISKLWVT